MYEKIVKKKRLILRLKIVFQNKKKSCTMVHNPTKRTNSSTKMHIGFNY